MANPVSQFRNNLFASRGCDIQSAIDYCEVMISTLNQTDQIGARSAIGVLINTIDNAVTQAQGPSPEKLAIIALIDERIAEHKLVREDQLRDKIMDIVADDDIDDQISNWMSNNFDITDYNVDDAIDSWMENNMDDKIQDAISNLTFNVTVS